MEARLRETLGEYTLLEQIGSGGMGTVFKAEHRVTRRVEALKVLTAGSLAGEEQLRRFEREIRLQASLRHPNIAEVFTAFRDGSNLVLAMELLEGRTLRAMLEETELSVDEGLRIMRQVLTALGYAHSRGIVHRDVSPSNIVINGSGQAKLTDFGLAIDPTDVKLSETGLPMGCFYYTSPEQIRGERRLGPPADLYSCGVVLYEILAGRRPFEEADAFSLMTAHVQKAPPPLGSIHASIPRGLEAAVMKAMAKEAGERFASAEEFLRALEQPREARSVAGRNCAIAAALLLCFVQAGTGYREKPAVAVETPLVVLPPAPTSGVERAPKKRNPVISALKTINPIRIFTKRKGKDKNGR